MSTLLECVGRVFKTHKIMKLMAYTEGAYGIILTDYFIYLLDLTSFYASLDEESKG